MPDIPLDLKLPPEAIALGLDEVVTVETSVIFAYAIKSEWLSDERFSSAIHHATDELTLELNKIGAAIFEAKFSAALGRKPQ